MIGRSTDKSIAATRPVKSEIGNKKNSVRNIKIINKINVLIFYFGKINVVIFYFLINNNQ